MALGITALENTKAFKKIRVGSVELKHRIYFAPCSRFRSLPNGLPSDLNLQYYDGRSKYPGTLVFSEIIMPSEKYGSFENAPSLQTDEHVKAWKAINNKIHRNGSFSCVQFGSLGRTADPEEAKKKGFKVYGTSKIYASEEDEARGYINPLVEVNDKDIEELLEQYLLTGKRALEAGFDMIELHMCHGFLLDTFMFPSSNQRQDRYGGSIENRARLPLEFIDRFIATFGADKVGIRLSPWATFKGMKAQEEEIHPITQLGYLLHELEKRTKEGNRIAFVSVIEPRVLGSETVDVNLQVGDNDFVKQIWKGIVLKAGNYTYDAPSFHTLLKDIEDDRTLVGFGRFFTSNPDLIHKLEKGLPLTMYDRDTFYTNSNYGYNTWNTAETNTEFNKEVELKVFAQELNRL